MLLVPILQKMAPYWYLFCPVGLLLSHSQAWLIQRRKRFHVLKLHFSVRMNPMLEAVGFDS